MAHLNTQTRNCDKELKEIKEYIVKPDSFCTNFDRRMKQSVGKNGEVPPECIPRASPYRQCSIVII